MHWDMGYLNAGYQCQHGSIGLSYEPMILARGVPAIDDPSLTLAGALPNVKGVPTPLAAGDIPETAGDDTLSPLTLPDLIDVPTPLPLLACPPDPRISWFKARSSAAGSGLGEGYAPAYLALRGSPRSFGGRGRGSSRVVRSLLAWLRPLEPWMGERVLPSRYLLLRHPLRQE